MINLGGIPLTVYDVECVSLFLTNSSHKKWNRVSLHGCLIRDHGLCMLQRGLVKSDITIKELWLRCIALTKSSSSYISDLAIYCKVKQLVISGNHTIGESFAIFKMLSNPASNLKRLHMRDISLSSKFTIVLFTELANCNAWKLVTTLSLMMLVISLLLQCRRIPLFLSFGCGVLGSPQQLQSDVLKYWLIMTI